jgi:phosphohistidine phosphatase
MKKLFLLRHAKSEWGNAQLKDFDRPLNERGRQAAPQMAAHFRSKRYKADAVFCSTARRTRETLELFKPVLGAGTPITFDDRLYLAEPEYILERIRSISDEARSALFIGHNPGTEQIAQMLVTPPEDQEQERLLRRLREKYSTCALAVIRFDAESWQDIKLLTGELTDFTRPKDLSKG